MEFFRWIWRAGTWPFRVAGRWGTAGAVAGLALAIGVFVEAGLRIDRQAPRIELLRNEIARIDKEIGEIKVAKDAMGALLARRQVGFALEGWRTEASRVLASLAALPNERTYLNRIQQRDREIQIDGQAARHEDVVELLDRVAGSAVMRDPRLLEVRLEDPRGKAAFPVAFSVQATVPGPRVKPAPESAPADRARKGASK